MSITETDSVSCAEITRQLLGYLRFRAQGALSMVNVYVNGSPWECDAIRVMPSFLWVEYEIKVSVSDYRADFQKKRRSWNPNSLKKHEAYASDGPIEVSSRGKIHITPKPKQFYFVTPKGLLSDIKLPSHCGLIEFASDRTYWGMEVKKRAPNLKSPTKLSPKAVFNLGMKAAHRVRLQKDST